VGQDVGELVDPSLLLALLLLGRVISAVLPQVALFPSRLDLFGDVDPALARQVVQLSLEPVKSLLRQPRDSVVAGLGHKHSSYPLCGIELIRRAQMRAPCEGVIYRDYFVLPTQFNHQQVR
jgi:hypothetical protein